MEKIKDVIKKHNDKIKAHMGKMPCSRFEHLKNPNDDFLRWYLKLEVLKINKFTDVSKFWLPLTIKNKCEVTKKN